MKNTVTVSCQGIVKTFEQPLTLEKLSREFAGSGPGIIIMARVNGRLRELRKKVKKDCHVEFITTAQKTGYQTYVRTATFLLTKAVSDVLSDEPHKKLIVQYSIGEGLYCELEAPFPVTQELLDRISTRMDELVAHNVPITKTSVSTDEAIRIFHSADMRNKEKLFRYRRASNVNIYAMDGLQDYNYGYMAPSAGYIHLYALYLYDAGFVLQLPTMKEPDRLAPFVPSVKLFAVLKQSTIWGQMMDVATVADLNDVIARGEMNQLILIQEALQEKKIAEIAQRIVDEHKRIVLIAGPSSSGKTTFSHRLSIQLGALGRKPHPIPMDDYFLDRDLTPLDADGKPDFECLDALNIPLLNAQMTALLSGKAVTLPSFNFITGRSEWREKPLQIGSEDILVIEGIHGLNDALLCDLPADSRFRIYISALTQLNVDEHNRIPTTDGRLLRRIVRDVSTRGSSCTRTISMWDSVRSGEERNIFPYQENADEMFNSALIYELAVLKLYAEPHLFGITNDQPEYDEAKRLLKFLDYFLGISSDCIPSNSILREFIGGSCFKL